MQTSWPLPSRTDIICTGPEWLLHLPVESQDLIRSRIIMVLWRSWHLRNEIIHGKTIPPLDISCSFLSSYYNSYNDIAMSVEEILKGKTPITASAHAMIIPSKPPYTPSPTPAVQQVALSVDGSFDPVDGSAGAGMILRDDRGAVIFASYRKLFHCNEALEAELQAMTEGLHLAMVHSHSTIVLQVDCSGALKMIGDESFDRSAAYGT
ncbi:protein transport protein sec24 [Hordeum vulgare]|nr:protein transport protein sec24 [Hordeum vulgare]